MSGSGTFTRQATPPDSGKVGREKSRPTFLPMPGDGPMSPGAPLSPKAKKRSGSLPPGESETQNVKVVCRVRPFMRREMEIQDEYNRHFQHEWEKRPLRSVVEMEGHTSVMLDHEKEFKERERFNFDISCWSIPAEQQEGCAPFCSQKDVMNLVGAPSVKYLWAGFNTCIFAYGQTGSGKTYTMMGTEDQVGLTPRICQALFRELEKKREEDENLPADGTVREYRLEARFLEIYNEKVKDLLWGIRPGDQPTDGIDKENLRLRNIPGEGPRIAGITIVEVDRWEDCMSLIEEGTRHRSVAATKMNDTSSRSHSIFRVTLIQTTKVLPTRQFERPKCYDKSSVISLVDLAGSERQKKTESQGARLREAININLSLTTLKNVIDALVEGRAVIPFRDSNLTWLLSDNLGGNSKTFMISCVSPHWDNAEETLNTMRYALRAQGIVNHARVNESEEMRRFNKMKEELARMQKALNENPDEATLKQQFEEKKARMRVMQFDALQKEQEAEEIERHMASTKEMQKNAAYHHAFREVFFRRLEKVYHELNLEIQENQRFTEQEAQQLEIIALAKEAQVQAIAIEEKVARENRESLEARVQSFREECQSNDRRVADLMDIEDHMKNAGLSKMSVLPEARRLGRILIEWHKHRVGREVEKTGKQIQQETVELQGKSSRANRELKQNLDAQQQRAEDEQQSLRVKTAETGIRTDDFDHWSKKRIAELHSTCIFYENEKKRLFDEQEKSLLALNQDWSTKFYAAKEAKTHSLNRFNTERKEKMNRVGSEVKVRTMARERELREQTEAAEKKAQEDYGHTVISFERKLRSLDETWRKKLSQLTAHNVDIEAFLREASVRQPRYMKLYDAIMDACEKPQTDLDVKELVNALNGVDSALQSNAPHTFRATEIAEVTVCSPAPLFGTEEPKGQELSPSKEHKSREHAPPVKLFSPYVELGEETEQPSELKPARMTSQAKLSALSPPPKSPTQTKTSMLRTSAQKMRRQSSGASSRLNISTTRPEEPPQGKIVYRPREGLYETFLVTRTKSPAPGDFVRTPGETRRSPSAPSGRRCAWR